MNKWNVVYLLLLVFTMISCNQEFSQETESFENYLKTTFDKDYKAAPHYYLIVSQFRCHACVIKTLDEIATRVNHTNANSFTILTFDFQIIPDEIRSKIEILSDSEEGYESLGISLANLTIVKTDNYKIRKITVVNLDEIQDIVSDIFGSL